MLNRVSKIIAAAAIALSSMAAKPALAELIAHGDGTRVTYLEPLRTGVSALTFVWTLNEPSFDRVAAVQAGLASTLSGGTETRTSYEINSYKREKGIKHQIATNGPHLTLTVSAPNDVFPETLIHLENILLEPVYTLDWYARELENSKPVQSTLTRRPAHVLSEVANYLHFQTDDSDTQPSTAHYRFGRPAQAILRSGDQEVQQRTNRLIHKLPLGPKGWTPPLKKWTEALFGDEDVTLPKGVIHFEDPQSTEMLILFVKAQEFAEETDQVATNLLVNYVGDGQGSELFRVIRQEMRASYDPQSNFVVMGKKQALFSFSATVEASRWPEIHSRIDELYANVRQGDIDLRGLNVLKNNLNRIYFESFFNDAVWGLRHYLNEYPEGTEGVIKLPLFQAFGAVTVDGVAKASDSLLPPLDDYLLILIGGGAAPTEALKSQGYCALPRNTDLSHCLKQLSAAQN